MAGIIKLKSRMTAVSSMQVVYYIVITGIVEIARVIWDVSRAALVIAALHNLAGASLPSFTSHCRPGTLIVPECALAEHTGHSLHSYLSGYSIRCIGSQSVSCKAMVSSLARDDSICCSALSIIAFLSPKDISLLYLPPHLIHAADSSACQRMYCQSMWGRPARCTWRMTGLCCRLPFLSPTSQRALCTPRGRSHLSIQDTR